MTKPFKELQGMNKDDLAGKLYEVKKENIKLQAQVAIGTVPKNSMQIRNHKRTIARILTLLNQQKPRVERTVQSMAPVPAQKTHQGPYEQKTEQQKKEQKEKKLTSTKLPRKQKGE